MKSIRAFEIEKIASNIIQNENITKPPISATEIADLVYDLSFEKRNLDDCSTDGDVLAAININTKVITINSSKDYELFSNEGRKNFTIAHELGHYVLHKEMKDSALIDLQTDIIFCREVGNFKCDIERQADLFAVYLLMPENLVRTEYDKITQPFDERTLRYLADIFCVSKQAMKNRLSWELNLLYVDKAGNYYRNKAEFQETGGQQKLF